MLTRRESLKALAGAALAVLLPWKAARAAAKAPEFDLAVFYREVRAARMNAEAGKYIVEAILVRPDFHAAIGRDIAAMRGINGLESPTSLWMIFGIPVQVWPGLTKPYSIRVYGIVRPPITMPGPITSIRVVRAGESMEARQLVAVCDGKAYRVDTDTGAISRI